MITTKEAYKILKLPTFLFETGLIMPNTPEEMETRRRMIDFKKELHIATFMLAMSFKDAGSDPMLDLFEQKDHNNVFKHAFYRQHYLYSSVFWYSNSFEMILQTIWFQNKLYNAYHIDFCTTNFEDIVEKCNIKSLCDEINDENLTSSLKSFKKKHKYVFDLAKRLKHRQFVENDSYLLYREAFDLITDNYDSTKTTFKVNLPDLQKRLIEFHNELVDLAERILQPIYETLNLEKYD